MAAGLRPDPLGELKRPPDPPSRNKGGLLLRGGERREEGREERGKGKGRGTEGRRKGKEGEGEGGTCSKVLGGIDAPDVRCCADTESRILDPCIQAMRHYAVNLYHYAV